MATRGPFNHHHIQFHTKRAEMEFDRLCIGARALLIEMVSTCFMLGPAIDKNFIALRPTPDRGCNFLIGEYVGKGLLSSLRRSVSRRRGSDPGIWTCQHQMMSQGPCLEKWCVLERWEVSWACADDQMHLRLLLRHGLYLCGLALAFERLLLQTLARSHAPMQA